MNCRILIYLCILLDVKLLRGESFYRISVHLDTLNRAITINEFRAKIKLIKIADSYLIEFYHLTTPNRYLLALTLCYSLVQNLQISRNMLLSHMDTGVVSSCLIKISLFSTFLDIPRLLYSKFTQIQDLIHQR